MKTDFDPIWRKELLATVSGQLMKAESELQRLDALLWNLKPVLEDMTIQAALETHANAENGAWIRQLTQSRKALSMLMDYLSGEYSYLHTQRGRGLPTEVHCQEGPQNGPSVESSQEPEVPTTVGPQLHTD